MPVIARILGGAGTGKTTALMDTMSKVLDAGIDDPLSIGFVSFTKAARREASERAASRFGGSADELEDRGWFKTLHAVCYKVLGVRGDSLLAGSKADKKWIADTVGGEAGCAVYDAMLDLAFDASTDAGKALGLWDLARNSLIPFAAAWHAAWRVDDRIPSQDDCERIVTAYEQGKRLDGRCDFVDLLGRVAGYRFTLDGPERRAPEGDPPNLPVWFLDEQQDASPLLNDVCQRLIESARWVYVVGDPFQSIYGWAGASGRLFMGWPAAKETTLPKSYRCPSPIHYLGESILRGCSDYFDRGIAPADHGGDIESAFFRGSCIEDIDPRESWLVLARTNFHVARIAKRLKAEGIPWLPMKGNGGWNAPARNEANETLWALQNGGCTNGKRWKRAVDHLPAKLEGHDLLVRGTKTEWAELKEGEAIERYPLGSLDLGNLPGATPRLLDTIRSGAWRRIVDRGEEWCLAVERWGEDAVKNPKVRVGTIHSVKGAEADNVLWLTTLTNQIRKGRDDLEVDNEEHRLAYVAVTRARRRLVLAVEPNAYRFEVPL